MDNVANKTPVPIKLNPPLGVQRFDDAQCDLMRAKEAQRLDELRRTNPDHPLVQGPKGLD